MKTLSHLGHLLLITVCAVCVLHADEGDTYEALKYGTNTFTNVRIIQESPVDILIGHDAGYVRIPLQKLPEPLKAKYPYDAQKADDYKKQEAEKKRLQLLQDRSVINQQLLAKEAQLRQQIETQGRELKRINKDIATQSKLPRGPAKKNALATHCAR